MKIFIYQGKHKIKNLQSELSDGLLLTEVIEAVTHQKVPDIQRKPKSRDIMITNIQASKSPLSNVIHPRIELMLNVQLCLQMWRQNG